MMFSLVLLAAAAAPPLASALAPVQPQVATRPHYGIDAPTPNRWDGFNYMPTPITVSADRTYRARMLALRTDALEQQARDGGTLTPEHRATLQTRLDRIQLRFAEMRRRADPFSVDGFGHAVYSAHTRRAFVQPPSMMRRVAN
jgi:hypothetical protein